MIPVQLPSEPPEFDRLVRQRGQKWRSEHPDAPVSKYPNYWLDIKEHLEKAFSGRCAYLGTYIDDGDVDHFIPKSRRRCLAYEWRNLRWSDIGFNQRSKRSHLLLDPIRIKPGWLYLNPKSLLFEEGPNFPASPALRQRLKTTLDLLNSERRVRARGRILDSCYDRSVKRLDPDKVREFLPALLESLSQV